MSPPTDPLSQVLAALRLRAATCARVELGAPFAVRVPAVDAAQLHVLVAGTLWLQPPDGPRRELTAGAAWLVAAGAGYALGAGKDVTPEPLAAVEEGVGYVRARGGSEPAATLLCLQCDPGPRATDPLAGALPPCIVAPQPTPVLDDLARLLDGTLREPAPGSSTVALRLAELCLLGFLRSWLSAPRRATEPGWLAALQDPGLSRALGAMIRAAETRHDLDGLARVAAMSRSRFASRFRERVGRPPLAWLGRWRVHRAADRLLDGETVDQAAAAVGFASTSAFSRAFVREIGCRPGEWARQAADRARSAIPPTTTR